MWRREGRMRVEGRIRRVLRPGTQVAVRTNGVSRRQQGGYTFDGSGLQGGRWPASPGQTPLPLALLFCPSGLACRFILYSESKKRMGPSGPDAAASSTHFFTSPPAQNACEHGTALRVTQLRLATTEPSCKIHAGCVLHAPFCAIPHAGACSMRLALHAAPPSAHLVPCPLDDDACNHM